MYVCIYSFIGIFCHHYYYFSFTSNYLLFYVMFFYFIEYASRWPPTLKRILMHMGVQIWMQKLMPERGDAWQMLERTQKAAQKGGRRILHGFWWIWWILVDFAWNLIDVDGFWWILVDFAWNLMDVDGCWLILLDFDWFCMEFYGFCMEFNGFWWILMDFGGFLVDFAWNLMDFAWNFMDLRHETGDGWVRLGTVGHGKGRRNMRGSVYD